MALRIRSPILDKTINRSGSWGENGVTVAVGTIVSVGVREGISAGMADDGSISVTLFTVTARVGDMVITEVSVEEGTFSRVGVGLVVIRLYIK